MDTLVQKLNMISDSYFEFVDSVVDYAQQKESHLALILDYLSNCPNATSSDILYLISSQPDFFDNEVPDKLSSIVI